MNPTPKEQASSPTQTSISVFVGIDWADAKHDICLLLPGKEEARHAQIENTPDALHDWVLKLIEEFGARGNIYVATEKARGALLYTLMQYPQLTLFPLNSKATGKLREACGRAGLKMTAGIAACKPNWSSTFTIYYRSGGPMTCSLASWLPSAKAVARPSTRVLASPRKSKLSSKLPSPSPSNFFKAIARAS